MRLNSSLLITAGTLGLITFGCIAPTFAQTTTTSAVTSTITYRRTDLTSGVFNGTDTTPYFYLPTFNSSLGTLLSVNLVYNVQLQTQITAANSASIGSQPVTIKSITSSQTSVFYNIGGSSSGDQTDLGGTFINPTSFDNVGTTDNSATATTTQFTFADLQPQETRTSPLLTAQATNIFTYKATGATGTGTTNDAVINAFNGDGNTPIRFGVKTNTNAFQTSGGGNVSLTQATNDQFNLSVSYTYQPVPAPPAAVSMGIGSFVGLVGTGVSRLRTRKRRKKA